MGIVVCCGEIEASLPCSSYLLIKFLQLLYNNALGFLQVKLNGKAAAFAQNTFSPDLSLMRFHY